MHSPDDFRIRVTAGTDYDPGTHVQVRVNDATPLHLQGPGGDVWLNVRIKNHKGGEGDDLQSTLYFEQEPHKANDDTYGMGVYFVPRGEDGDKGISGEDLQWGNDFDEPLRDRLPPGFGAALRIVKWWIDPGLEGDPYADKPYLYGPALSSFNRVYAALGEPERSEGESEQSSERSEDDSEDGEDGEDDSGEDGEDGEDDGEDDTEALPERSEADKTTERSEDVKEDEKGGDKDDDKGDEKDDKDDDKGDEKDTSTPSLLVHPDCGLYFSEGGDAGGRSWRASLGCPDADADGSGKARMKWALGAAAKAQWTWQYGQGYGLDFYNGYLDFADLTLRLPGFTLPLLRYYASAKAEKTCLRYVLRHRQTGRVYLVVVFSLVRVNKQDGGDEDEEEEEDDGDEDGEEVDVDVDEDEIVQEARQKLSIHDEVDVDESDVD